MPTQYEILLQKQLQEPNPLDEYGRNLVDLARYQAGQRFAQQQAEAHLAGQRELLKEQLTTQSALEAEREKAAFERAQLAATSAEKRAEIAAQAAERGRAKVVSEQEQQRLIREFQELGIERKKNETDEDYITRAQGESRTVRGQHLATLHNQSQDYIDQINDIATKASASYPQRLSDYAWQRVVAQADPTRGAQLAKAATPAQRDAVLNQLGTGKDATALRLTYQLEQDKARQTVPVLEPKQQIEVERLKNRAGQAERALDTLLQNPRYAPAIPEFNRLIGRQPPEVSGAIDFSRIAPSPTRPGAPGGGAAVAAAAPRQGAPEILGPSLPGPVQGPPLPAPVPAPATPDEILSGQEPMMFGARPLYNVGAAASPVVGSFFQRAPRAIAEAGYGGADILGSIMQQQLGTSAFLPTPEAMQERRAILEYLSPSTERNIPAPTRAEIAAGTAARNLRTAAVPPGMADWAMRLPAEILSGPVPTRAALPGVQPGVEIIPPAPIARTMSPDELRATRIRQAIRLKYPRVSESLNVTTLGLSDLQDLYRQLETNAGAFPAPPSGPPAYLFGPRGLPAEIGAQ